ncbi:chymotrypsin isoform X2 [Drosophila takahashii]|uniref:chymotrypsin isoform X2 n=1 Tax=Drosophila takahashii TaxID=29030 RepID=UPI001CF8F657|nr:chymotrypsin isoform X2 [Drosophila takahashii]
MILQLVLIVQLSLGFGQQIGSLRIMNGTAAKLRQLPYQVGLLGYFEGSMEEPNMCGGTILSNRWIVTAAHCLQDPKANLSKVLVHVGRLESFNDKEIVVNRSHTIVHKKFDRRTVTNDIALIRLPKRLTFSRYIQAAKLPSSKKTYSGRRAIISGWGLTTKQQPSKVLQYIRVPIISNKECERQWNKQLNGTGRKVVPSSFICIDSRKGLPCRGDSGGPMVLDDGSRTLVGIVSHGFDGEFTLRYVIKMNYAGSRGTAKER